MFSGKVRGRWLWNTSFTAKKTSYQDFKKPKNRQCPYPHPAANRRGWSHEGNSAPSLLPCLSLSPLANFPTYARTTNVQTLKLLLCALYRLYNPCTRSSNTTRPIQRQEARSGPRPQTQYPFKTFTSHYTAADERLESSVLNNNPLPSYQDGGAWNYAHRSIH